MFIPADPPAERNARRYRGQLLERTSARPSPMEVAAGAPRSSSAPSPSPHGLSALGRPLATSISLVVLFNILFLIAEIAATALPTGHFVDRVRAGFESGALRETDRVPMDTQVGWDAWSDCFLLHTLVIRGGSLVADALGPPLLQDWRPHDPAFWSQCPLLRYSVAEGPLRTCPYLAAEHGPECQVLRYDYTRYWHGNRVLLSALLIPLEVGDVRILYKAVSYAAALLLAVAVLSSVPRSGWPSLLPIPIVALTSMGFPFFGQSLMHAPVFILILLVLAALVWLREPLGSVPRLALVAAGFGASCTFLEFWVGAIPVAAALILYCTQILFASGGWALAGGQRSLRPALTALGVFLGAVALSMGLKLGFSVGMFGWEPVVGEFLDQLVFRVQGDAADLRTALQALAEARGVLGSGSRAGAALVLLAGGIGWVVCLGLVLLSMARLRSLRRALSQQRDCLTAAVAAALVVGWLLFFRNHTTVHAYFMVRTLCVPVALGLTAPWLAFRALRDGASPEEPS